MATFGRGYDSRQNSVEAYNAGLERLADAASGVYSLWFADWCEALKMLNASKSGDPRAATYAVSISNFLKKMDRGSRKHPPLCFTCEQAFSRKSRPMIIAVILPHCDQPPNTLVGGFCAACAAGRARWPEPGWRDRLTELLTPLLQQLFGPELRFADAFHLNTSGRG